MSAVGDPLIELDLSRHFERIHPLVGERPFRTGGLQGILRVARNSAGAAQSRLSQRNFLRNSGEAVDEARNQRVHVPHAYRHTFAQTAAERWGLVYQFPDSGAVR
jgi:hypothetical protein